LNKRPEYCRSGSSPGQTASSVSSVKPTAPKPKNIDSRKKHAVVKRTIVKKVISGEGTKTTADKASKPSVTWAAADDGVANPKEAEKKPSEMNEEQGTQPRQQRQRTKVASAPTIARRERTQKGDRPLKEASWHPELPGNDKGLRGRFRRIFQSWRHAEGNPAFRVGHSENIPHFCNPPTM
jgi:hypothetical protein